MDNFTYVCAECGISDFFKGLRYNPNKWMGAKENKAWQIGFQYAKSLLV